MRRLLFKLRQAVQALFSRDYLTGTLGDDPVFSRSTTATVVDFEGLVKTTQINEARFQGMRRVDNLILSAADDPLNSSDDMTGAVVIGAGSVTGFNGEYSTLLANADNGAAVRWSKAIFHRFPPFGVSVVSAMVRGVGSSIGTRINIINSQDGADYSVVLNTDWQRITGRIHVLDVSGNANVFFDLNYSRGTMRAGDTVEVKNLQIENVTGQANQNPSEYVSTNVVPFPYHGANVDGAQYFDTYNGNTVVDNVVTEATGNGLGGLIDGLLMEPAATNKFINSDVPVTQTISGLTGDHVCWMDGTGTVTLSGGATGVASDGVPVTFDAAGADVTFTVAGGPPVRMQVESTIATSYIPTAGAAVTRTVDTLHYPQTTPQSQGAVVAQLTMATDSGFSSGGDSGIVAFDAATAGSPQYFQNSLWLWAIGDGSSFTSQAQSYAVGDRCIASSSWAGAEMSIAVANGAWAGPASVPYDGAFNSTDIVALAPQLRVPMIFVGVDLYNQSLSKEWIEENYP